MEGYKVRGDRIRELRIRKRMTQQRLASTAGISITQVNRIENAHNTARFGTIERIAEALEVDPDDLIEFSLLSA